MSTVDWDRCAVCRTEAHGRPYPRGWAVTARRDGVVCPSCSPSGTDRLVIVRGGKICAEEIAKMSVDQLRAFLAIHALAPHPEALEGTAEVQAAVRAELASRGVQ
jgi:hypothetical protein